MHRYQFTPTAEGFRPGIVTIERPLGPAEADLFETGPMWRIAYEGEPWKSDAFLGELTPLDGAPEPEWGDWWDAEDYETSGGVQFYIETGERQTRRVSWEFSIAAERVMLAAEATVRRATAEQVQA